MENQKEFLIGCNYWASNAGCFTWKRFDEQVIRKDLEYLAGFGVNCIRIFPTWDDFQPIAKNPIPKSPFYDKYSFKIRVNERVLWEQKFPESGLCEEKLEQFKTLLDIAKEYGMKVIVAFITGWMSGRRFVPEALRDKDVIADPEAILWECRFIKDMIAQIKHYDNIIAWEPGNECNCLSFDTNEGQNELWLMSIVNAIRLADDTRPVYSGIHTVNLQGVWNQRMLARHTDVLTTHPYPGFTPYCDKEDIRQMRASMHAACETSYYSSVTGKPCMVEEINTLGPGFLSDEFIPEYFETSLMTSLAVGTTGYLWWCGFEQDHLDFAPYDCNSLERNLGLAHPDYTAKPVLEKMKEMSKVVKEIGVLPPPKADAVCVLPFNQDHWKLAYGAYMLGLQAGRHIDFMYEEEKLRDSEYYLLPCIRLLSAVPHVQTKELAKKVAAGAKLLVTYDGGGIGDFEKLTGLKIAGRTGNAQTKRFTLGGKKVEIACQASLQLVSDTARVLLTDEDGEILLAENDYGKGKVVFFNAPLENFYTESYLPENTALCEVYKAFFAGKDKVFAVDSDRCMVTLHELEKGRVGVMINSFEKDCELGFSVKEGYRIARTLYAEYADINGDKLIMRRKYAYLELERE